MTKIKYVGVKEDGETAFAAETGIARWMRGDSHEIPAPLAAKLLKHPDVFAEDGPAKQVKVTSAPAASQPKVNTEANTTPTSTPAGDGAPAPLSLAPGGKVTAADPLEGMDDEAVRAFAKEHKYKIVGIGLLKGKNLRAKVHAAFGYTG